jgi:hypothetical protein
MNISSKARGDADREQVRGAERDLPIHYFSAASIAFMA